MNLRSKELIKSDPRRYLLGIARRRASAKGREFSITIDDIKIPDICPILGIPLRVLNEDRPKDDSLSIDRKDNTKGYIPENINIISYRANTLKKDGKIEEFEAILKYMKSI